MKNKLLTIGKLGKITGVHIKSLRYYDEIGILPPAYVDPETNYRYYSFSQIHLVEAIRFCAELDIPLKRFTEFTSENNSKIHYKKLIEQGTALANAKIKAIQDLLEEIKAFQQSIQHAEDFQEYKSPITCSIPDKYCYIIPFDGTQDSEEFHIIFNNFLMETDKVKIKIGVEMGLLLFCRNGKNKQYFFADVNISNEDKECLPNIIHIPSTSYVCKKTDFSNIGMAEQQFPDLFSMDYDKIIMELELLEGEYNFSKQFYELRCSMPPKNSPIYIT